jgi:hypothetical protein
MAKQVTPTTIRWKLSTYLPKFGWIGGKIQHILYEEAEKFHLFSYMRRIG